MNQRATGSFDELRAARELAAHVAREEWYDAALLAQRLGRSAQAAELYERVNRFAEAAQCWYDATDYDRVIDAALRVPRRHALHRASAELAFRSASVLSRRDPRLDRWAQAIGEAGLSETGDVSLHHALGAYLGAREDAGDTGDFTPGSPQIPAPPAARPALPKCGDVFAGRYRLESALGAGGSAMVFLAHDQVIDERVALKIMTGVVSPDSHARLRRELQLARKLTHESIVRVFDLIVDEGVFAITMEAVEGSSLGDVIESTRLPLRVALDYLVQAARALGFAHERGIVHRDVKPDNMLIARSGTLKISDFGIAKTMQDASITRTGSVLGTPFYIAPEQVLDSRQVDHRADIYALGVVAYQLFTGQVPFGGDSIMEVLGNHMNATPTPPSKLFPELPHALETLVLDMLQKDPAQRVKACTEVVARLRSVR